MSLISKSGVLCDRSCLAAYALPIANPRPEAVYGGGCAATRLRAMELTTILNRCHRSEVLFSTETAAIVNSSLRFLYNMFLLT